MGWARIDDGFDDHPKVLALLDMEDGALWLCRRPPAGAR